MQPSTRGPLLLFRFGKTSYVEMVHTRRPRSYVQKTFKIHKTIKGIRMLKEARAKQCLGDFETQMFRIC